MKVRDCAIRLTLLMLASILLHAGEAAAVQKQVGGLLARHAAGQTILTWEEVDPPVKEESISVVELKELRRQLEERAEVRYRVYRSESPIHSIENLEPIAEVPPLTCWNADFFGVSPRPDEKAARYVVEEGKGPVPPGTGIYACNPKQGGEAFYAVTVSMAGEENPSVQGSNCLQTPVRESVGPGVPVLQRIEKPDSFQYIEGPTLHYYVRWESPPHCNIQGKPFDYLVAVPPHLAKPAPVGIHLHCWGGSLNGGYGWWYNAEKGHLLIASNQIPYDWWTGYHELYGKGPREKERWQSGVVRAYTQRRMLAFLDWVATQWDVDLARTHVAGSSMGGSGSLMLAIRFPEQVAWGVSWVGVHTPLQSPQFQGSYAGVYGEPEWQVKFEDGTPVWDYFDDAWYLRKHRDQEVGLLLFSNGKNDGAIGWPQAVRFYQALQETKRPHVFVWGQGGHGQRARMPVSLGERVLPIDVRTDQSLPAFTRCSLDDDPGSGDPHDGDPEGQVNLYLAWETDDLVDQAAQWEVTARLIPEAPEETCTVDVTPRRLQQLKLQPGQRVQWTNTCVATQDVIQSGETAADQWGLITLEKLRVTRSRNRIRILR